MIMRSENVPESPSSALQTTYFCVRRRVEHGLPLDAGRERRAAAAAQARVGHRLRRSARRRHRQRARAARDSRRARGSRRATSGSMMPTRAKVRRSCFCEVRDLFGRAERQRDARRRREIRRRTGPARRRRRPGRRRRGPPASRPRPAARARTGRASRCARAARRCRARRLPSRCARATAFGAQRERAGIARHEDRRAHGRAPRSRATMRVEALRRDTRRRARPSTIIAGEQAQLPRQ